jgi:mono/diheme cytochrome c family protein
MRLGLVLALSALLVGGCDDDMTSGHDMGVDQGIGDLSAAADLATSTATAARGEYLVKHLLFCGDCHTTPTSNGQPSADPALFLAGGRAFTAPGQDGGTVTVYAKNLTPDPTNGIGSWTQSNITDALTIGVDDQGAPLWPIMPYYMFGNLTPDDATSIALYLQSLPPSAHPVPEDTSPFPLAVPRLDDTKIPHTTLAASDPSFAAAERGRYLTKVACIECHTEHTMGPSVLDLTKAFAGGETFPLGPSLTTISANITPDPTGLSGWTTAEIAATMKTDLERGTGAMLCPPMPGGQMRLGGLTDGDLSDIATYVHTLPAISNGPFGCTDAGVPFGLPDGG